MQVGYHPSCFILRLRTIDHNYEFHFSPTGAHQPLIDHKFAKPSIVYRYEDSTSALSLHVRGCLILYPTSVMSPAFPTNPTKLSADTPECQIFC